MEHETIIRLSVFLGLFALLALAEVLIPRRARAQARNGRWVTNWSIVLTGTAGLRLLGLRCRCWLSGPLWMQRQMAGVCSICWSGPCGSRSPSPC